MDALRAEVAELAERVEFAERLLAQPRGSGRTLRPPLLNERPTAVIPAGSFPGGTIFAPWSGSPSRWWSFRSA